MLGTYIKMAYRQLWKNKVFSLLNISGLAVALAAAFLILQYLTYELGHDEFHKNKDEIFRVTYQQHENGVLMNSSAQTFYGVADFMKRHFPEVQEAVRIYKWPASTGVLMMAENRVYNERNYFFAQRDFFKVFSSLLLQGDPSTCLSDANSIVISERLALKMFGTKDAMGRSAGNLDRKGQEIVITGIMRDLPENSHFDLELVRPWEKDWTPEDAFNSKASWWTYVTIKTGTSIPELEHRLNESLTRNQRDNPKYKGVSMALQRITDIHLNSHLKNEIKPNGNRSIVAILAGAFLMILIIAWTNYFNLETARFITRRKEVGVRRIVGSSKKELVLQFFVQYLFINVIAILLSCLIVYTVLPFYEYVTGVPIHRLQFSISMLWLISLVIFCLGTFVTGIYPAVLLLRFNPIALVKGKQTGTIQGVFLRKSLLIFQFVSALILISFLVVISRQLDFMRKVNGHVSLDQILTVYNPTNYSSYEDSLRQEKNTVFRNKVLQNAAVQKLTTSSAIPGEPVGFTYVDLAKRSLSDPDKGIPYKVVYVDYDFLDVFGLKLKAGRNYSRDLDDRSNTLSLVVTESTVREMGFGSIEEALYKEVYFMEDDWDRWRVIGIVEDYRHESVKNPMHPTIFRLHKDKGQMLYYSILLTNARHPNEAVSAIEKAWAETWPEKPFNYFFMDTYYDQQYKSEIHFSRIFAVFSLVAMFISCLGILGMTLFEANARLKEISIRKVLGASVASLVALLTKRYFRLIAVASLIAMRLSYFSATEWLETYPMHMSIPWIMFVAPLSVVILLIAIASGLQTVKAARTNPVNNLRCE